MQEDLKSYTAQQLQIYQTTQDDAVRKEIADDLMHRYYSMLHRKVWSLTYHLQHKPQLREDLFQECCIRFVAMMDTYHPDSPSSFFNYAMVEITRTVQEMQDMLELGISSKQARSLRKMKMEIHRQECQQGHTFDLGVSRQQLRMHSLGRQQHYYAMYRAGQMNSVDELAEGNGLDYLQEVSDRCELDPAVQYQKKMIREEIAHVLHSILTEEEIKILCCRLGIDSKKMSDAEISAIFAGEGKNISPQEVKRLYKNALNHCQQNDSLIELLRP